MTEILEPDWSQPKPTLVEARDSCQRVRLDPVALPREPFDKLLVDLRASHDLGDAHLVAFDVGSDPIFDWYASRNRLWEAEVLDNLIVRQEIRTALVDLQIPSMPPNSGLGLHDPFLFDGHLSNILYVGGAYWNKKGDGRSEKLFAVTVCDAMFGLRFAEISLYLSYSPWTPWFKGIAWDLTTVGMEMTSIFTVPERPLQCRRFPYFSTLFRNGHLETL
jgi:hypothetical protein